MATGFNLHRFANPGRFLRLAGSALPWLTGGAAILFVVGLYLALLGSPPDYQQGDSVRIMYIHVPSAWMAMIAAERRPRCRSSNAWVSAMCPT